MMFRHQQLFIPSLVSLSNYTKGALLYLQTVSNAGGHFLSKFFRRLFKMSKQKSLSQLEAEKAACERQLVQLQHKVQQYENRIAYCEKGERR